MILSFFAWSLSLSWLEDDSGGEVVDEDVGDEVEVLGGSEENPLSLFKFKLSLFSLLDPILTETNHLSNICTKHDFSGEIEIFC